MENSKKIGGTILKWFSKYKLFMVIGVVLVLCGSVVYRVVKDSSVRHYTCEATGGNPRCGIYWDDTDDEMRQRYSSDPDFIEDNFYSLRRAIYISQRDMNRTEKSIIEKLQAKESLSDDEQSFLEDLKDIRLYQTRLINILDEIREQYLMRSH